MANTSFIPDHMTSDKAKFQMWTATSIALFFLVFTTGFISAPAIYMVTDQPFAAETWHIIATHFGKSLTNLNYLLQALNDMWHASLTAGLVGVIAPTLTGLFFFGIFFAVCPYDNIDRIYGYVGWATEADFRAMEKRKQFGIRGGHLGILGKTEQGEAVRLIETISVTCVAPPGAGKTAAVIVPAIINSSNASIIANDPKPEIATMTSGFRAEIGFVYILDWSMTDKPSEGIFHPRFNFLDKRLVPPPGTAERDTYLDAMAQTLVPDKKGGDTYFTDQGRECLVGYMHWLVSHVNDHGCYEGIPTKWHGKEASFPMMIDWLAEARFNAAERAKKQDKESDNQFQQTDPEQLFLTEICDIARQRGYSPRAFTSLSKLIPMADKERSGVNGTMNQSLLPFANAAVMERTSASDFLPKDLRGVHEPILKPLPALANHYKVEKPILYQALIAEGLLDGHENAPTSLALMKGYAYSPTSKSTPGAYNWDSQKIGELLNRLRKTRVAPEKGEELPLTLYVCVNQAEAEAFKSITALLYEVLSREYIAYGPGEVNKRGEKMGGKPILFIMDEFAKLPKCVQVLKGPDLGRSKKISYWFAYQAKAQMDETYGKESSESLNSTIGMHIILAQNDPTTTDYYIKMVGKTTIFKTSNSKQVGVSKNVNPFTKNESISVEGIDFLTPGDVSGMAPGTQLVLGQNFHNRPMKLRSPFFFEDPEMLSKVYNMRNNKGPQPAPPLPEHIRQMRIAEHKAQLAIAQQAEAQSQAQGLSAIALRKTA